MKKSDIYFKHIEKDTFFASQFLKHLELALKYKKKEEYIDILLFPISKYWFPIEISKSSLANFWS